MPARRPFRLPFVPVWKTAPLMRIVLPLMAGIIVQQYAQPGPITLLMLAGSSGACLAILHYSTAASKPVFGLTLSLALAIAGAGMLWVKDSVHQSRFAGRHYQPGQWVVATLTEPTLPKPKSLKAEAKIWLRDSSGRYSPAAGGIILYLEPDSLARSLQYGQSILFRQPLQPLSGAANPGGFDYAAYAARQQLFYQVYLPAGQYQVLPGFHGLTGWKLIYAGRAWVLQTLKRLIPHPTTAGVAEALLVGYRGDLDKALLQQYTQAGVVHIIAISGMHLGMVYLMLSVVLAPLSRLRGGKAISTVLMLACLWGFSLLTGAAPSITRAAVMFSAMALGAALQKQAGLFNALALAALLLLLYDPFTLWDAGFQLSFAAVLSIGVCYPRLHRLFAPASRAMQWVWSLMALTLSAQVFTLPLVLYHFRQFPVYFLLANLVAVPLSTLILYGLIGLLALSWIAPVAKAMGAALGLGIGLLNQLISRVGTLPHASIDGLYFTVAQAVLLGGVLACLAWWWLRKSPSGFWLASCLLCGLTVSRWLRQQEMQKKSQFIVYQMPKHTAMDLMHQGRHRFIGDSALATPGLLRDYHLKPTRVFFQAMHEAPPLTPGRQNGLLHLGQASVLWLQAPLTLPDTPVLKADLLLVSGNSRIPTKEAMLRTGAGQIVLDGTVPAYRLRQWQNAADSLHLRLHSVALHGAFVMDLSLPPSPIMEQNR